MGYRKLDLNFVDPDPEIGDWGWAQRPFVSEIERQYNNGKPVRIIVLKARQLGISTATEATLFNWAFLYNGMNGLVLCHEKDSSVELFEMTKLFWNSWPYRQLFQMKYHTKQNMHWAEINSRIRIATAKNLEGGRGSTIHFLHGSEVAFWPDPHSLWTGLRQTIHETHGSVVVLESTANGVGNWFYDEYFAAKEGESDFTALFFPWFKHGSYRRATTLTIKSELDPEEKQLLRLGATMENIAWRRWAYKNKVGQDWDKFMQEYPSTDEEAFIVSGRPIFPALKLKSRFYPEPGIRGFLVDNPKGGKPIFIRDSRGNLTVFRAPKTGDSRTDRYFVAGDPSESTIGDPACAQVINRQTLEQVAVWHGRVNPIHFARIMAQLGRFYNNAMLCPEVEGGGQGVVGALLAWGYPSIWQDRRPDHITGQFNNLGWSTNYQRKRWCIGMLQKLFLDGSITIHDPKTHHQLRNFVEHEDGYWGNANKKIHDDAVMALAIAVTASDLEGPFIPDHVHNGVVHELHHQSKMEDESAIDLAGVA